MEQYFTQNPSTKDDIFKFKWNALGKEFVFNTSNSVFSKTAVDFGTMTMIETFLKSEESFSGSILDLGCGYGPVGVMLAKAMDDVKITMVAGKILYENGEFFVGEPAEDIYRKANEIIKRIAN